MSKYTRYSTEELALMKEERKKGKTIKQLTKNVNELFKTDRNEATIMKKCSSMGWYHIQISGIQYKDWVRNNTEYNLRGKYIDAHTPIEHECLKHGIWKINPNNIKSGQGCPKCSNNIKLSIEDVIDRLKHKNYEVLDKIGNKIKSKCNICNKIWITKQRVLIHQNSGCPSCAKSGFDKSKFAQCYLIYFKDISLYKIGISNNYTDRINRFNYYQKLIKVWFFETGDKAVKFEKFICNSFIKNSVNTFLLNSGNTETFRFDVDALQKIKNINLRTINSNEYNMY